MITPIDDAELAQIIRELHHERFGPTPWRERHRRPNNPLDPPAVIDRRRRDLCLALDGYYRNDRPTRTASNAA